MKENQKAEKLIFSETLNCKCPKCGAEESVRLNVIQKYAHNMGLSFFPMGKKYSFSCDKCHAEFEKKSLPESINNAYADVKSKIKTPISLYSGSFVILLILIGIFVAAYYTDVNTEEYLNNPQIGDVYKYATNEDEEGDYTLLKVVEIQADTVFFVSNKYNYSRGKYNNTLHEEDEYNEEDIYYFEKAELLKAYEDGKLMEARRKK